MHSYKCLNELSITGPIGAHITRVPPYINQPFAVNPGMCREFLVDHNIAIMICEMRGILVLNTLFLLVHRDMHRFLMATQPGTVSYMPPEALNI